jgi:glyoxylase-like metal-dependent hydrolase (beta-lactamase superfamily II)
MKLFIHYCPVGFGNCYLVGTDYDDPASADYSQQRVAVVIDPGFLDGALLQLIEKYNYAIKAVLLTHDHLSHARGLGTLRRIYDFDIYAAKAMVHDMSALVVHDGDELVIEPFHFEVISVPGHSVDSVVFKLRRILFTGDVLTAGLVGTTNSPYGAMKQATALQNKILTLPPNCIVMPGHGPPSSLSVERRFNAGMTHVDEKLRNNRPRSFSLEFIN